MGPPPDPLPALPAALFGTRSAGGSTVTGHVPSSWCCHGPPVSPPIVTSTYRVSRGARWPWWSLGTIWTGVTLQRETFQSPKWSKRTGFSPKTASQHPPTPSRPPPAFTWGPPSPLHPGGPGSRLLLPGGPWGTEGGQRAPRAPPAPPGTPTRTHHLSAGTWGSLLPPGTPGAFLPLGGGERKGFRVRVEGEGGSST